MKLFGAPLSPFVRKARIVAAEKGIDYELDPSPSPLTGFSDEFLALNPLKRIPALLPDPARPDFAINDSSAICGYFEKLQPNPSVYPANAEDYGRALYFEELADTELAAQIGMGVFRPVFFNVATGKPADYETAGQGFEKLLNRLLAYLEDQLEGKTWLAGNDFSIADIAVTSQLFSAAHAGYEVPAARLPRLAGLMQNCLARETVAQFIEADLRFFNKMGMQLPKQVTA